MSEAVRRIAKIERRFAENLVSPRWEPHSPMLQYEVYASKWPGKLETLWTIINRNEYSQMGQQIALPVQEGMRYFDLWRGVELRTVVKGKLVTLSFEIEGGGYGAILATKTPSDDLPQFLLEMKKLNSVPLESFSEEWKVLPQKITEIPLTKQAVTVPSGMVKIQAIHFEFVVNGIEIEGGNRAGVDVQYPWEDNARRHHRHNIDVPGFYIDRYPVTNADFKKFLVATGYHPKDAHNFLRDWTNGNCPEGWENKPVTWVSLEDARAYAGWAGKRLPHDWEWQLAAQGTDGRTYPWGNRWDANLVPAADTTRDTGPAADVTAHPKGASPYGVEDLVGNVWQWTDEYSDEHTRAAVLRGGSHYRPVGSLWYFPQAYKLSEHGKFLLMSPGRDRSATVGFRCVVDAAGN
jgi:gamma-glutamyl hercynylcysteine S-oxide synthase